MTERCYSGSDAATLIHREPGEPPPSARQPTRPSTLLNLLHFHFHSHPQNHPHAPGSDADTHSSPLPLASHIHPPIANTTTNTPPPQSGTDGERVQEGRRRPQRVARSQNLRGARPSNWATEPRHEASREAPLCPIPSDALNEGPVANPCCPHAVRALSGDPPSDRFGLGPS